MKNTFTELASISIKDKIERKGISTIYLGQMLGVC